MKQKKYKPNPLFHDKEPLTIGIPRALLYPRQITMWKTFFEELGMKIVVSPPTNRRILENGTKAAIDEMCLAVKIYLGHVEELAGHCDMILVPRIVDYGIRRNMCTTFEGLPDIVSNIFRGRNLRILSYSEVESVSGFVGNFTVKIRRKARYVDETRCAVPGERGKRLSGNGPPPGRAWPESEAGVPEQPEGHGE